MQSKVLDHFEDLSTWTPIASGQVSIHISQDSGVKSNAMRVDFDFKGGGGFVVARKPLSMPLPEAWAFKFNLKAHSPAYRFEFKLIDRSGLNVWWYHSDVFEFPCDWQTVRLSHDQFEYAWGPDWGEVLKDIGAIEWVIAVGPEQASGGVGTVWIEDLCFETQDQCVAPIIQASGFLKGFEPEHALDGLKDSCWKTKDDSAVLSLDFQGRRELGGLVIQWRKHHDLLDFEVELSEDGLNWLSVYRAKQVFSEYSYVYLPDTSARCLRLNLSKKTGEFAILDLRIMSYEFSRSIISFLQAIARNERKGRFPKYLYGEQTYWTPVGIENGSTRAILNEEGMAETDEGSFSIEPFLFLQGRLLNWADFEIGQELEKGFLPFPSSVWQKQSIQLKATGFAAGEADQAFFYMRYRIENKGDQAQRMQLFVAVRPFQVTPPWQSFTRGDVKIGGISAINELAYADDSVTVNGLRRVISISKPDGFGCLSFQQGNIAEYIEAGELPKQSRVSDSFGLASGAFAYSLQLAPGESKDIVVAVPFGQAFQGELPDAQKAFEARSNAWSERVGQLELGLPAVACDFYKTYQTAVAHILINRDGPALQPGPRRYTRSWIRDGAIMASALLMAGCSKAAKDFIIWYADFQKQDGNVPCCVDDAGPDWLVEYDSQGELVFAIAEYFRISKDIDFLARMWPFALKSLDYFEFLRNKRLTGEYLSPEKLACYGLLPESASHEGYLAHPVHAYWDDFWAIRGLKDAVFMAEALGETDQALKFEKLLGEFRQNVYASIRQTMQDRQIEYIPGSVEWADCDPSATAVAIAPLDELHHMPEAGVKNTFDIYLKRFRDCRSGAVDWPNYTAYEIRIIPALIRMGMRLESHELFDFFLSDRRPVHWNQWPEISWKNPKSPGHIGDMPHTWIAAEYVLAFRTIFAYECEADSSLVIAAGIPAGWLAFDAELKVQNLITHYGKINYSLRLEADGLRLSLSGSLDLPSGGILFKPPLLKPIASVEVDGRAFENFDEQSARIAVLPAELKIFWAE